MNSQIAGYCTYIETMGGIKYEQVAHPQCELELAHKRWCFLQRCADAEGCWVVLERVEVTIRHDDFHIVRTEIVRTTVLDSATTPHVRTYVDRVAFKDELTCIPGGKTDKSHPRQREKGASNEALHRAAKRNQGSRDKKKSRDDGPVGPTTPTEA